MPTRTFFDFLALLLYRHRIKHSAVFIISTLIVALFSSVMFFSHALQHDLALTLEGQPDMVVQRMRSGKAVDTPILWADESRSIKGVRSALPRVFGRYFYEPNGLYFTIIGIDPFDVQATTALQKLVEGLDLKRFLAEESMLVGSGVKALLDQYRYLEYYDFRLSDGSRRRVSIYDALPASTDMISSDTVIMDIDLAREILGIDEVHASDIVLDVPNALERDNVMVKLILKHYDIRVIQKKEIEKAYKALFDYKGGLFLLLYMIVLVTFVLILYQRYSMIDSADRKEIGILRAVGWSIKDVIRLKVLESLLVALFAFGSGVLIAYGYVFFLDAPLLSAIFFGSGNLTMDVQLSHTIDFGLLSMMFLFFIVPFIAAVLVPSWKIAVTDPVEAMR